MQTNVLSFAPQSTKKLGDSDSGGNGISIRDDHGAGGIDRDRSFQEAKQQPLVDRGS